jgi:tetratricopeptide (TPR) repeat protein
LVVVVGDHGEGLGQHVEKTHGYTLYEATQHVPWIVRTPDRIAAGRRTYNVVSLVDLSPTVLDYLGLRVPGPVSGRSLAAALRGAGIGEIPCHAAADDPFLQNGWSPLRSITTEQWKYIRTAQPELYDLQADPRETRNLAAAEPVALARMARMLDDLEARMQPREAASVQLSAEERRALESLGYLRGRDSSPEGPPSADLPDVKEMLPYDVAAQEALDLLISGKVQEGVERLQRIVEESPAHLASRVFLGEALERQGKLEQAIAAYQQALQLKPDYPDALIHLGTARVAQGRLDDAVAAFDEALRIDPDSSTAHYNLGLALMHLGQLDEAISQFEEALRGDDGFPNAHGALGRALIQRGRRGEALEHLRQEIKSNPQSVEARLNLATLLAESDAKEADRLLREALKIAPENPQVHYNLGAFLLMHKRPGEALAPLAEAVRLMPDHPRAASELARARRLSGQSH